ncbi:MAG TPA: hypothetical protein VGX92_14440 [Pyrinomonadaceae bacterium]|jgi:hypothetical protein|nr:hypothetical protein [Pyrinomonadaceae bacterium]
MTKLKRLLIYLLVLASLLSFSLATARAEDREFKAIAAHLKSRYQAKQKRIPFLGLANLVVRMVRPAGVKSFKVAIFEHLNHSDNVNHAELNSVIRGALDQQWQPLVRVYSRKKGEQVFVYVRKEGENMKLMVVSLERTEAFVARVKLSPARLAQWMENPEILGFSLAEH